MSPPTTRYLALGDSYTIGEGVQPADRWPERLAAALRSEGISMDQPTVVARTGWTTQELGEGMDAAVLAPPYDLVSLLIGVNDQYRGRPRAGYEEEFGRMLARAVGLAGGRAGRVLVLSIPDWGVTPFAEGRDRDRVREEIDGFNAAARDGALAAGAGWVDVTEISRTRGAEPGMLAEDGLHPSGAMYAEWAALALPAAREMLTG